MILLMLYYTGIKEAFTISILRILLAGFLFGNMFSILYSLAGGLLSLLCMALFKKTGKFKVIAVSAVGGITHNLGQIIVAVIVVENMNLFFYFPVLLFAGVLTGIVIGIAAQEILLRLPENRM